MQYGCGCVGFGFECCCDWCIVEMGVEYICEECIIGFVGVGDFYWQCVDLMFDVVFVDGYSVVCILCVYGQMCFGGDLGMEEGDWVFELVCVVEYCVGCCQEWMVEFCYFVVVVYIDLDWCVVFVSQGQQLLGFGGEVEYDCVCCGELFVYLGVFFF